MKNTSKGKILTTPRSYGKNMPELFAQLEDAGYEVIKNTTGSILSKDKMKELIADCVGVIVGVDPLDSEVLACAPKLRAIAKYGVGVDNIDMNVCKQRNILVSRTIGANSDAVADYTMILMLAVARKLTLIDQKCRKADWGKITTRDVSHATLGIFGLGAIGKRVAQRAKGFGMKIMGYDPNWDESFAKEYDIKKADKEEILRNADFVTLHLPLLVETQHFISEKELNMMKPDAVLINTARGGLVDEKALLKALKENRIYGAGIDAFENEPPEDNDWFTLDNVILGSHCAASTHGATENMGKMATENLLNDLKKSEGRKMSTTEIIKENGILPVVVLDESKDAINTAKALLAGGIKAMEITFRTAAASQSIKLVADSCPEMLVGAGTVINLEQCKQAIEAGAKFIVSPGFDEEVVKYCVENSMPVFPGCVTPSEIMQALKYGLKVVKFFPANVYGGLGAMKSLSGPFIGIQFIPTGGVNTANIKEYHDSPFVFAVGGSWICPKKEINAGNFDKITQLCKEAITAMNE